jgi:hypothetical protein
MEEQEVLQVARAIRPRLPELIGNDAEKVDRQLEELLKRAGAGEPVKVSVLKVLRQREGTREWANSLLKVPPSYRSYQQLPGRKQVPTVPRYVCPEGHGDPWYRFSVAEEIPRCLECDHLFVPAP